MMGGNGTGKNPPMVSVKTFFLAWGPPHPYETSAVLSQGGTRLRDERREAQRGLRLEAWS